MQKQLESADLKSDNERLSREVDELKAEVKELKEVVEKKDVEVKEGGRE